MATCNIMPVIDYICPKPRLENCYEPAFKGCYLQWLDEMAEELQVWVDYYAEHKKGNTDPYYLKRRKMYDLLRTHRKELQPSWVETLENAIVCCITCLSVTVEMVEGYYQITWVNTHEDYPTIITYHYADKTGHYFANLFIMSDIVLTNLTNGIY